MDSIKEQWEEIKEIVRNEYELMDISFNTWIAPLKIYDVIDDTVYILVNVNSVVALNYLNKSYKILFEVTISEMFNHKYEVNFVLEKDLNSLSSGKEISVSKPVYNINYENANLNSKYKFDTFVVGNNNKFAHSASLAVAESPGEAYNPLFIYGESGLGKTHLMHSIGHFILEQNPDKRIIYVTSEDFTNEVIESIREGNATKLTKLREKYRTVDVLMIDDIQFIIGKDRTQEEFFHTFNALHSTGKQIILSSDKPPKEMKTLEERLRSRFEWGLIADIQPPDYETRIAILQKNAENYNMEFDKEIFDYIANNVKSNIRELEGAFNKIIAFSKLKNIPPSMASAEEALKDIISPDHPKEVTPQSIINMTADQFEVKPDDIVSQRRNSEFVLPRQIVMYLCRELMDLSYANIAKLLGKKDHTTIIHGVEKVVNEMKNNEDFKNKIDTIIKKINPS